MLSVQAAIIPPTIALSASAGDTDSVVLDEIAKVADKVSVAPDDSAIIEMVALVAEITSLVKDVSVSVEEVAFVAANTSPAPVDSASTEDVTLIETLASDAAITSMVADVIKAPADKDSPTTDVSVADTEVVRVALSAVVTATDSVLDASRITVAAIASERAAESRKAAICAPPTVIQIVSGSKICQGLAEREAIC